MKSSEEIERTAAAWLARRDSENWSEHDEAELRGWLLVIPHRVAWLRLEAAWQETGRLRALAAGMSAVRVPPRGIWADSPFFRRRARSANSAPTAWAADAVSAEYAEQAVGARRSGDGRSGRSRYLRLGAAAAALVLAGAAWMLARHADVIEQHSFATNVGIVNRLPLADGSRVTLSSGSRIEVTLSRGERHIDLLQGEAYFDVAKDAQRPFVVAADGRRVIAVGTQFSVRADPSSLRVIVAEGRVRLESDSDRGAPPSVLAAGMIAIANDHGVRIDRVSAERTAALLAWRSGLLSFRDTPLSEAVGEFNRYNARKLVIEDAAVAAIPISGNFRWSNADAFVRLLEHGFALHAQWRDDEIVLSSRR